MKNVFRSFVGLLTLALALTSVSGFAKEKKSCCPSACCESGSCCRR